MEFIILGIIAIISYLLPFLIAAKRKHEYTVIILIFVLVLGWTFIGWVVCLIWACSDKIQNPNQEDQIFENKNKKL